MACDVELLDGMRPVCVGLLLMGDLHTLLGLVGFLKLSSALGCTSLSPSSSQHSSALCTFTLPWLLVFMSARYHSNGCALKRVSMNSGGGAVFQSLLHDSLLATAHVESCALFRKKDGSVKAASAGYQV